MRQRAYTPLLFPRVSAVTGDAPDEPNVFTDGSLWHARCGYGGYAGCATVWPHRGGQVSECECQFTDFDECSDAPTDCVVTGVRLHGPPLGSARSEIMAVIVAMLSPYAVHAMSDSRAVVHGHARVMKAIANQRPWTIANWNNSDLWQIWLHLLADRGPSNVKISWVKGHMGSEGVQHTRFTELQRRLNDKADYTAKRAARGHQPHVRAAVDCASDRAATDRIIAAEMQHVMLHAVRASMRWGAGHEPEHGAPGGRKQVWCCFTPPAPDADPVSLRRHIRGGLIGPRRGGHPDMIHKFLMNIAFTPCAHGVSWLELYMGFLVLHDCTHVCDRTRFAEATVHQELNEFRRLCNHELDHRFHMGTKTISSPRTVVTLGCGTWVSVARWPVYGGCPCGALTCGGASLKCVFC